MKNILILISFLFITACSGSFDAKKLDIRKECSENNSNKTLSDIFCKKK